MKAYRIERSAKDYTETKANEFEHVGYYFTLEKALERICNGRHDCYLGKTGIKLSAQDIDNMLGDMYWLSVRVETDNKEFAEMFGFSEKEIEYYHMIEIEIQ